MTGDDIDANCQDWNDSDLDRCDVCKPSSTMFYISNICKAVNVIEHCETYSDPDTC